MAAIGPTGSIIVYSKNFEKACHENLAARASSRPAARAILALNERLVDLLPPFRKRLLYSCEQAGSASLKKVLPAFTGRGYEGLEIADGLQASTRYLEFQRDPLLTKTKQKQLFKNLKAYCGLDTQAMVDLVKVLGEHAT
jgi:hypothetical protein